MEVASAVDESGVMLQPEGAASFRVTTCSVLPERETEMVISLPGEADWGEMVREAVIRVGGVTEPVGTNRQTSFLMPSLLELPPMKTILPSGNTTLV